MPEVADAELPKFKLFRFIDYTVAWASVIAIE